MTQESPGGLGIVRANRRRAIALAAVVVLAMGLGWPLVSQLIHPPEPRDQPENVVPQVTAEAVATPLNQGTRLEWAPGIQTWRHWYVPGSDMHLANLHRQGFAWVKQRYAWADLQTTKGGDIDFEQPEMFLKGVEGAGPGFKVMIQLDVPPEWAFADDGFSLDAWGGFTRDFASRFAGRVHAYEIGNEPNLAAASDVPSLSDPWNKGPDPESYADVLATAYAAIKAADPNALVVSAGLSPTAEDMPNAMDDQTYLSDLYAVMASRDVGGLPANRDPNYKPSTPSEGFFDALGAHAPGFRAAPEVAPEEAAADPKLGGQRFFTFRRIEDLRKVMEDAGDADKRVVITEFGWTTDQRPDSPYTWSAVSHQERADYTRRAFQYAADHWASWVGPMFLFTAPDPSWGPEHEAYWRAVTDNEGWLLDGLSLAGLGVVAQAPVGVPAEVEAERAVRTEERVPPLTMVPAIEPALGTVFANSGAVRRVGGAIAAASRDGNRLAVAEGRHVVLLDVSHPEKPAELARSEDLGREVASVAIAGEWIAAGFAESGDTPATVWVTRYTPGDPWRGAEVDLPNRPAGTMAIGQAQGQLSLSGAQPLVTRTYCVADAASEGEGAAPAPSPSDDCTLQVLRLTNPEDWTEGGDAGDPRIEEVLSIATDRQNHVEPALGDGVVFVARSSGIDAYVPGAERYQQAGRIELAGQIFWMSVADHVLTVLSREGQPSPAGHGFVPATLYVLDVSDPRQFGPPSEVTDLSGERGFRDHGTVGVVRRDCDEGTCYEEVTMLDVAGTPRVIESDSLEADERLLAVIDGAMLVADSSGLSSLAMGTGVFPASPSAIGPHMVRAIASLSAPTTAPNAIYLAGGRLAVADARSGSVFTTLGIEACGDEVGPLPRDVAALGGLAVVASGVDLVVVDPDPENPMHLGCAVLSLLDPQVVATEGVYAYVGGPSYAGPFGQVDDSDATNGLRLTVVDVSAPTHPVVAGTVRADGLQDARYDAMPEVADIAAYNGRVYLATGGYGERAILVFDVSHPDAPHLVGQLGVPASALLATDGRLYAAVACPESAGGSTTETPCSPGLRIYGTTGTGLPRELGTLGTTFPFQALAMADDGLWASGGGTVWLIDVTDATKPRFVDGFPSSATSLAVVGSHVLAGEGAGGLTIFDR